MEKTPKSRIKELNKERAQLTKAVAKESKQLKENIRKIHTSVGSPVPFDKYHKNIMKAAESILDKDGKTREQVIVAFRSLNETSDESEQGPMVTLIDDIGSLKQKKLRLEKIEAQLKKTRFIAEKVKTGTSKLDEQEAKLKDTHGEELIQMRGEAKEARKKAPALKKRANMIVKEYVRDTYGRSDHNALVTEVNWALNKAYKNAFTIRNFDIAKGEIPTNDEINKFFRAQHKIKGCEIVLNEGGAFRGLITALRNANKLKKEAAKHKEIVDTLDKRLAEQKARHKKQLEIIKQKRKKLKEMI